MQTRSRSLALSSGSQATRREAHRVGNLARKKVAIHPIVSAWMFFRQHILESATVCQEFAERFTACGADGETRTQPSVAMKGILRGLHLHLPLASRSHRAQSVGMLYLHRWATQLFSEKSPLRVLRCEGSKGLGLQYCGDHVARVRLKDVLFPDWLDGVVAPLEEGTDLAGLRSLTVLRGRRRKPGRPSLSVAATAKDPPAFGVIVGMIALANHAPATGLRVTEARRPTSAELSADQARPLGSRLWVRGDRHLPRVRLVCKRQAGSVLHPGQEVTFTYSGSVNLDG